MQNSVALAEQGLDNSSFLFRLNGDIGGARKYLGLFCEKGNTSKQYVQKWLPIVAASQSVKDNLKECEILLFLVDNGDYK